MNTTANITYLLDRRKAGFNASTLSPANGKAYEMLDELTENFTDMDMVTADESFEKTLDLLVQSMKADSPSEPSEKDRIKEMTDRDRVSFYTMDDKSGKTPIVEKVNDGEPKFKVGDWVRERNNSYPGYVKSLKKYSDGWYYAIRYRGSKKTTSIPEGVLVAATNPGLSPAQKKRAATIRKKGSAKKSAMRTYKSDGASFADKMRQARAAKKKPKTELEEIAEQSPIKIGEHIRYDEGYGVKYGVVVAYSRGEPEWRGFAKFGNNTSSDECVWEFAKKITKAEYEKGLGQQAEFTYNPKSDNVDVTSPEGNFTFGFSGDYGNIYGVCFKGRDTFVKLKDNSKAQALFEKFGTEAIRVWKAGQTEQSSDSSSKKGDQANQKKPKKASTAKGKSVKAKFKIGQYVESNAVGKPGHYKVVRMNDDSEVGTSAYVVDGGNEGTFVLFESRLTASSKAKYDAYWKSKTPKYKIGDVVTYGAFWYKIEDVRVRSEVIEYSLRTGARSEWIGQEKLTIKAEPKEPQPNKQDQAYLNAKHVKVPSVELKHIKKFVSLTGEGTKDKVIDALATLQREIKKGILGKKSPFAAELDEIQDTYLDILHKGKAPYKVALTPENLAKYVGLAGGEKVYKSVELLLSFIGWSEVEKTEQQIKKLASEIRNAKAKGKIKSTDPYANEIDELASMLAKAGTGTKFDARKVDLQGISGLAGLGYAYSDAVSGLGGLPASVPGGVMSANQLMSFTYPTYNFSGNWGTLLGHPQTNAKMMIWGEPGQGKSTMAYQLARYLASSFGTVMYVAQEEINQAGQASMTVQTKLKAVGGPVEGWRFTGDLHKIDGRDKFVFIDSVNSSGLTEEDFAALTKKYPNVFFVLIFQATKEGKFKGTKDWEHLVDIVAKVELGEATTSKNRFAELNTVTIF